VQNHKLPVVAQTAVFEALGVLT